MLFAIEGIDGAGKGTLAKNLLRLARSGGVTAASLSFPRYGETRFAELIGQYLNGRFGALDEVPVRFAALLYAGDRFESRDRLLELMSTHDLVILDRYVASNIAYNTAKLPADEQADFMAWIDETEFGIFDLPVPELTCLLETGTETADQLVSEKGARGYTSEDRDLHEADREFMVRVAALYDRLAAENSRSTWFRCRTQVDDGALRPPQEIAAEVWSQVHSRLNTPS